MTRRILNVTSIAASTTALATQVTSTGAALTLAATAPTDGLAHLVTLTSAGGVDLSGVAFTVAGFDADGHSVTESIAAGPNGTTVTSTKWYASGISVKPAATMSAKLMDVGIAASCLSVAKSISLDGRNGHFTLGISTAVLTGSPTWTLQHTFDNVTWYDDATIASKTSATETSSITPVSALRLKITAYGGVNLTVLQFGNVGFAD